ncbi:hypothetical protein EYC84_000546 [Monilinia fructicola]|uniref:Uncharacterized protein n=1 Tax=Monilinia fructicola TaxID=38448 RepID=A0A5M9JRF0_MONFR|nr:hypothetical protein EYC84_000546 [Monilinia fructicola]
MIVSHFNYFLTRLITLVLSPRTSQPAFSSLPGTLLFSLPGFIAHTRAQNAQDPLCLLPFFPNKIQILHLQPRRPNPK